jgi:hypothetical protein
MQDLGQNARNSKQSKLRYGQGCHIYKLAPGDVSKDLPPLEPGLATVRTVFLAEFALKHLAFAARSDDLQRNHRK